MMRKRSTAVGAVAALACLFAMTGLPEATHAQSFAISTAATPSDLPTGEVARPSAAGIASGTEPDRNDAVFDSAPRQRSWYGWQILLLDGLGLGLSVAGILAQTPAIGGTGLGIFLAGGPAVHFAHGNVATGFASLGLRAGGTMLFSFVGLLFVLHDTLSDANWAILLASGGAAVSAIDAGLLSYDTAPRRRDSAKLQLVPFADRHSRSSGLLLHGAF
jgi:hypothetical protein